MSKNNKKVEETEIEQDTAVETVETAEIPVIEPTIETTEATSKASKSMVKPNMVTLDLNDPASLRALKEALDKTALAAKANGKNITVRELDGEFVIAIKPARSINKLNQETGRMEMSHKIEILLSNHEEYIEMDYRDFMELSRIVCSVESETVKDTSFDDGVVYSNELKRDIPLHVTAKRTFYSVKTPTGETFVLDQDAVNL